MLRKFLVNFKPRHQHPRYDARFDRGVTVSVEAADSKAAIKAAKADGVHKQGDYPGSRSFDWWAAAIWWIECELLDKDRPEFPD